MLPFFLFSRSHFNPLPPHGGRPVLTSILRSNPAFQSTPSAWRETSFSIKLSSDLIFQSTPSAWRETARQQIHAFLAVQFQSTPSAWRETAVVVLVGIRTNISIHSLRMEGDYWQSDEGRVRLKFQSTPSAWRETLRKRRKLR